MTDLLLPVRERDDILPAFSGTPVADLLAYHNLRAPFRRHARAELLIGMCMDYRACLRIPPNFAYILRTAGANCRGLEFQLSFAIAIGGVRAICLIGHSQCGMVDLAGRREAFVQGLSDNAGWSRRAAEAHFDANVSRFEVGDAAAFVLTEARRLETQYPKLVVAPLLLNIEDGVLCQLQLG